MNYDLEELYRTNDWKNANTHKGELVFAYNTKVGSKTLHPRVFYALYIKPNDIGNGHLIYRLSTDQILVTKEYQLVPVPEDLIKAINKTDSSNNKIQVDHLNSEDSIVQDDHSNNNKDDNQTKFKKQE